jgi:cytochrome c peroxidase
MRSVRLPFVRRVGFFAGLAMLLASAASADSAKPPQFARADDEKKLTDLQLLGKRIFEDTNLSEPRGMSCASCHAPQHAFQGNNRSPIPGIAAGSTPDKIGTRKVPTIMYKTYSPAFGFSKDVDDGKETLEAKGGQFWDGRASDLAAQATGPMLNPIEMNNPSIAAVVQKVKAGPYVDLAKTLFGEDAFADPNAAMVDLTGAIYAYEASERFAPFSSRFDDYLRGKAKLTPIEARGFELFTNPKEGNCIACHVGKTDSKDPTDWIFTDFTYDALGAPRNNAIPANADPTTFDLGLCKQPGIEKIVPKEIKLESLCGAFKVPTLRNVAVAGAFYHNAAFASLHDAVSFYATRDTDPKRWYPKLKTGEVDKLNDLPGVYKDNANTREVPYDRKPGQKPRLSDADVDALVAFLKTLTDRGMQ